MRNRFTNPANGAFYDWLVNHAEEENEGKTRNIGHGAPTGNVGLIRTQGEDSPYVIRWRGSILHRSQHVAMWEWFKLSQFQTIYLRDFYGDECEVQIINFAPVRQRKLMSASRDPSIPHHYWTYEIAFEVYRFITGDMQAAGVTP